jgi:hypothetical protein
MARIPGESMKRPRPSDDTYPSVSSVRNMRNADVFDSRSRAAMSLICKGSVSDWRNSIASRALLTAREKYLSRTGEGTELSLALVLALGMIRCFQNLFL